MKLSILAGSWLSERSFDVNESRTSFTLGIMTPINRANAPKAHSAGDEGFGAQGALRHRADPC